jgi:hypothetical protein
MSRPAAPPPKIGFAASAMLAGVIPITDPPKHLIALMAAAFGVGIDTRLANLMLEIKVAPTTENQWQFSEACKVALRDNDTAFFQHAARITEKLAKKSNLRLFVLIVGKVDKQTPLAVITEKVNQWLVSVGEKPVAIDRVAYEMKAMRRKYKAGKNKK